MKITWLGHSSFILEDSNNIKVLTDPFDDSTGYKVFSGNVDAVTISHHHFDHDYTQKITCPNIIDKTGDFNFQNISIKGFPSYHDKVKGAKRGKNIIFIIEMDGYRLCHLGDLGYILSREEINNLKSIDVLFIPVGGNFTIDGKEAAEVAKLINPHIIIPMHYKTPDLSFELDGLETFLKYIKSGKYIDKNYLNLSDDCKNQYKDVKILDYK
ncbi:MAG: MBL fold metallo-hydrolase [Clostridium tyrobutyricum]|jgi:L-ascorbate metabolism protein UlaG (beta-lactamase superfamily)|uniref:MBL fold metallo-hydrolase n=1 Tax=Clostridium tyrobutyricum TaxID=1519 RepID=UPI000313BFBF|nr:MBL fold metallo-hydrolase [Clostridium tyrobutyricum]MBR9648914.1 MBL fold metallo-hydrolase [Clostridium tyrobutyricum]MBV4416326.1 MBL fold metallo-hydrolase [Clostridium tyrobutyricum]MBV4421462.1 MBL fold metallo-hydrolase [Clostridium tyrobutyricum]MBV4424608.1 MBL fold metallo-hydrolase [Clostridium tyrobutyricum]MBV4430365.1 MBL fold metallo-hydrolase [Clostridium tyrobutyricum]